MKSGSIPLLFFALLVLLSAPPALAIEESPGVCPESVGELPVECTGGNITSDVGMGACRAVTCTDEWGNLSVLACDKPDETAPEFFELYKQEDTSNLLTLCLGDACISDNGYAQATFGECGASGNDTNNDTNGNFSLCGDGLVTGEEECDTFAPAGYVCTEECALEEATDGAACPTIATLNATCVGGSKITDTAAPPAPAGCRIIACANGDASVQALVCPKEGVFEMYKQSSTQNLSTMPDVCVEGVCLGGWGYKLINETCEGPIVPPVEPPACIASVKDMVATCQGGGIVDDTFRGCRTISCVNDGSALRVFACDKPDGGTKTYFEMYKHFQIGEKPISICLGDTCMSNQESSGFAKSDLPACTDVPPPKETSAEMHIAPWYPQGNNYIFVCSANNFVPESFNYYFGDGSKLEHVPNTNVYHTYAPGEYTVTCVAKNGMVTEEATMRIVVPGPKLYLNDWQKWETFVPGWVNETGVFKATNTTPDIRTEAVYKEGYGWTDYVVTGSMVFWSNYAPADSRLVFRYQDPMHYGACRIMQDYGQTRLELIDGDSVLNATPAVFSPGQWYTLRASIDGDTATCEVVGQPQTKLTAKYNETPSGTVGLRNAHVVAWYKDVTVELQ